MFATHALVRRPSPRLAEGLVTHIERADRVDVELAQRQWLGYCAAMRAQGWTLHEVPPIDECPDGVFIEDTMLVYGDLAIMARPGALVRRPEVAAAEVAVEQQGYRIAHITAPGTLDGGDVLKAQNKVWVGLGGRTNTSGLNQLRHLLRPFNVEVIGVPLSKVLHLKSAVTALPDGTIIGHEPLVDDPRRWAKSFLPVPEEAGAHVVLLGGRTLLMAASAPASAALFRDRGHTVIEVDISEFEKLEGCVTCLSVRLRGRPG